MAPASVAFKVDIDGTPCIVFDLQRRYREFLAADPSMTFGEWLKHETTR